ncbi:uncharacterized protein LOC132940273 [Metopolophium dirhodum]|uniref:uncharacterized protein LOC132940273 n=1 Tax=Metopolophium dirhodum TaxID=44670 RepID=UPI00298FFCBE|nr:uncharacterized protein LOC132940273 [Metopolophium dirhodum]
MNIKMNAKNNKLNFMRLGRSLESSLYPSLVRVLSEAHRADAISYNHKFQKIFMNRLAEDLWYNNPLYPERERTSVCSMPFAVISNDLFRVPDTFSWGVSRDQAATIIQSAYRAHMVRIQPDVAEMRAFWRALTTKGRK